MVRKGKVITLIFSLKKIRKLVELIECLDNKETRKGKCMTFTKVMMWRYQIISRRRPYLLREESLTKKLERGDHLKRKMKKTTPLITNET